MRFGLFVCFQSTTVIPTFSEWRNYHPNLAQTVTCFNVASFIVCIFGCVGSILTMIIIGNWDNLTSGATFMFTLAFTDMICAFHNGIIERGFPLFGLTLSGLNDNSCAFSYFLIFLVSYSSYYLTVFFSLDKCFAVWLPFKYRQFGKPRVCLVITVSIYIVQTLYCLPTVFAFGYKEEVAGCTPENYEIVSEKFYTAIQPEITIVVNGFLPVAVVLTSTSLTIMKIRMRGSKRRGSDLAANNKNQTTSAGRKCKINSEMIRQMIVVCLVFGVFNLAATSLIRFLFDSDIQSNRDQGIFMVVEAVVTLCISVINSGNFYLYIIFGKKFRNDFIALFSVKKTNV